MRNGNYVAEPLLRGAFGSSYRTYEEWKQQFIQLLLCRKEKRSYRTYEEWKLSSIFQSLFDYPSSYRTYEEWKR